VKSALAAVLAALLTVGPAAADDSVPEPDVVESRRSFKLFDNRRTVAGMELFAGPLWSRRVQATTIDDDRRGFERGAPLASEIGFGAVQMTPYAPFYLIGVTGSTLRVLDDKSFRSRSSNKRSAAGSSSGRSSRMFASALASSRSTSCTPSRAHSSSRRASTRAWPAAWQAAHRCPRQRGLLWRWFGSDYVVRSFTIGLRLEIPPKTPFPAARD